MNWLWFYILFIEWFFTYLEVYIVFLKFDLLEPASVWSFCHRWFLCIFFSRKLFYIQFIDWFCTCLDLYVVSFIWINVACMISTVLQEVITLYSCDMIITLYPVHWLIPYLCRFFYVHCCHLNYYSMFIIGCFTKSDYYVNLWHNYHHVSISLIDTLPV